MQPHYPEPEQECHTEPEQQGLPQRVAERITADESEQRRVSSPGDCGDRIAEQKATVRIRHGAAGERSDSSSPEHNFDVIPTVRSLANSRRGNRYSREIASLRCSGTCTYSVFSRRY
jgi:hypothetical protein